MCGWKLVIVKYNVAALASNNKIEVLIVFDGKVFGVLIGVLCNLSVKFELTTSN